MLVFPHAKINLGLNIVEKRPDGFHNIESCFYPVPWTDALEIVKAEQLEFHAEGLEIPDNGVENLCVKAYRRVAADFDLPPVSIHLLKNIPIGAGLGGGSSDAAFVIKTLNNLFNLDISQEKQLEYARRLGSDCAFFILDKPKYCFGKGDQFEDIDMRLTGKWIVLINPGIHIATVEAYAGVVPEKKSADLRYQLTQPIRTWKNEIRNDFEATLFVKYPLLNNIKQLLYSYGAIYASMSGSGSTLFGIFEAETDLSQQFAAYKVWQGFLK